MHVKGSDINWQLLYFFVKFHLHDVVSDNVWHQQKIWMFSKNSSYKQDTICKVYTFSVLF